MKDWINIKEVRKKVKEKIGNSVIVNKSNSQVMQIAYENNIVSANDMHIWDIQEQCRIGH
mgnify:CR=1 FL=1|tara:strand:+ start:336 stop:515 length:180 start_codon:yes stop_codon:yes gene_type:complete